MSHVALVWALRQDLKPIPKFVLVVLADAANSEGVCWPRVATIGNKTGISARTVQRSLQLLVGRALISIEQRYRSDGSCSSNLYRLHIDRGVSAPPPPDGSVTTPCRRSQWVPDRRVMSGTTRRTDNEPPLLHSVAEKPTVDRGGGEALDLIYPGELLAAERAESERMIALLQAPLAQLVLDEWAGIIAAGAIRASPLGCLRELVKRARVGTFTPERGLRVARARKQQQRVEAARAAIEWPELPAADESNPLVRRLRALARSQSEP